MGCAIPKNMAIQAVLCCACQAADRPVKEPPEGVLGLASKQRWRKVPSWWPQWSFSDCRTTRAHISSECFIRVIASFSPKAELQFLLHWHSASCQIMCPMLNCTFFFFSNHTVNTTRHLDALLLSSAHNPWSKGLTPDQYHYWSETAAFMFIVQAEVVWVYHNKRAL